jgi:antibiotic biosynthesis monooxygenase (ABM) superfamily enzyme
MSETRIIRINSFSVPADSRGEFLALIERTHAVIRRQPGFIDDMILEQQAGAGPSNLMTVLQFEGEHALQPIIAAVSRFDAEEGIDRQAVARRLGVETGVAFYRHAVIDERELAPA